MTAAIAPVIEDTRVLRFTVKGGSMISPMLCQKAKPFSSDSYYFEPKWNGVRCIADVVEGKHKLFSRSGKDITVRFPEIVFPEELTAILDGEIVCFEDGIPVFNNIQCRVHVQNDLKIKLRVAQYPATYCVFDILKAGSEDLKLWRLTERKKILEDSSLWQASKAIIRKTPYIKGNGEGFFQLLCDKGYEGVVAKAANSLYSAGRSAEWLKARKPDEGVFYICGVTKGKGNRDGKIGSLILGEPTDAGLKYVGEAGSGLTFADLEYLPRILKVSSCSFDSPPPVNDLWFWTTCESTVDVEYFERSGGNKLIFPAVKRINGR